MRLRTKGTIITLLVLAAVVLVFVPLITGPYTACNSNILCIPQQRQSVTRYFLGFGGESSYGVWPNSRFYYFCTFDNCGSPLLGS